MEMFIPVRSNMEREPNIQGHLEMANVYSYWLECADGRWAPAWRDIDIMSLPASMLQYVAVCDMTEDGDFSYRYWGRGHTAYHRQAYSNKRISQITPSWARDFLHHQYMRVVETRQARLFETVYDFNDDPVFSLRMPLSNDGKNLTGVISVSDKSKVASELRHWICLPAQTVIKPA